MIELMEERVVDLKELKEHKLIKLRNLISERIFWRISSEYYDNTKVNNLMKNEQQINDIITELLFNDSIDLIDNDNTDITFTIEDLR